MRKNPIVPNHKDDQDAINALANADEAQIILVVDALLEWLQDGNWPVSVPIGRILANHINGISYKIVDVLRGEDSIWKYFCMRLLLMNLNLRKIPNDIIFELKRLVLQPTDNDVVEGAAESAEEILSGDY
jgi:Domain of unknown function (DUF5071)